MKRVFLFAALLAAAGAQAGFLDQLRGVLQGETTDAGETTSLSNQEMIQGVLDALSVGVQRAVAELGQAGGYLDDPQVRIPLPAQLRSVESLLRRVGQDRYADQFIASMNGAAEQAVPVAKDIFLKTIRQMNVEDARGIVTGSDDAATEYFRSHTREELQAAFLPIVRDATDEAQVTARYKQLADRAQSLSGGLVKPETLDLDRYVTDKALDGLFVKLADEERRIREDPVARSTELLKKVFGRR